MFEILFLGTGASVPSRDRSLPCVAVRCGNDVTLFDCGEGSQRQLMVSQFSFMKVNRIFITHLHGDHILGLPGLLQTMGMSGRKNPISVYGPKGIRTAIEALMNACEGEIDYPLEVTELVGGGAVAAGSYSVTAFSTQHTPGSIGFVLREKDRPGFFYKNRAAALGIKPGPDYAKLQNGETVNGVTPDQVMGKRRPGCSVAYTGDTAPCESVIEAVRGVDVLIHEATYVSKDGSLAKMHSHSTSADAAGVAKECGVRELFLTHISNRYNDASVSLGEAVSIFPDTVVPSDLQLYQVTHSSVRSV